MQDKLENKCLILPWGQFWETFPKLLSRAVAQNNFYILWLEGLRKLYYILKNFILFYFSAELFGASGVSFAINDGTRSVETALRGQGQTVQPGK